MASWKTWLAAVASLSTGLAGCSGGGGGGGDPAGVCLPGQQQACYAGPAGTAGVGRCAAGSQPCVGGQWGACAGAVLPTAEACNGVDDDCDGAAVRPPAVVRLDLSVEGRRVVAARADGQAGPARAA